VNSDQAPVGCTGKIIVATRGTNGPGEALIKVKGGTEAYIAFSEQPLARGTEVLVWNARGERSVDVMEFTVDQSDVTI
jgi:hypothetical protein